MKYLLILLVLICGMTTASAAFAPVQPVIPQPTTSVNIENLSRTALEARLGGKLTFKERIGLSVARGKAKRAERRAKQGKVDRPESGMALISFFLGLLSVLSVLLLFVTEAEAFFSIFLILSPIALIVSLVTLLFWNRNPQRKGKGLAIAGVVMSGLTTLFAAFILILIAAY